jgi:diguanylate cyclase (GGDEF)-like protein
MLAGLESRAPRSRLERLRSRVAGAMRRYAFAASALGIAAIGWLDYVTGYGLRMFPLYFAPVAYASAARGRNAGVVLAGLSAAIWFASTTLTGIRVPPWLLSINAAMHFVTCAWIAVLIARMRALAAAERENARVDPLTGLPNQRALAERISLEQTRHHRGAGPLVVACMDLDHFKDVNDRDGHAAGDAVLRSVAAVLRHELRDVDLAARVGGDEFVLLLPETGRDPAHRALERLRVAIADRFRASVGVTASIGAVVETVPKAPPQALVAYADAVLYAAKRAGRNRVEVSELPLDGAGMPA